MSKIQDIRQALNQKFLERSNLIDGMLTAVLAGEHLLMVGPPGTAKSMITKALCSSLTGATFFEWLMTKFTTPEEVFGPLSLKALEQDRFMRNTSGKMPESHIVFDDEIFKSNSAILNSKLTLLNERKFANDGKMVDCPLITCFGASNELPQGEELGALYDRFLLRFWVDPVRDEQSARMLFRGLQQVQIPTITLQELEQEQQKVDAVKMSMAIEDILIQIRRSVDNEGILVSDRRWSQIPGILRAYAYLNGNAEITEEDLEILCNVLWSTVEQRAKVRKLVAKFTNPIGEKLVQITDSLKDIESDLAAKKMEPIEAFKKVGHAIESLQKLDDPTKNKKLFKSIDSAKALKRMIAEKYLGLSV